MATAYYNGKDKMNGETGVTASGYDLDNGKYYNGYRVIAADSRFPLGTKINIHIDGEVLHCIVLDRGGAVHGNHFDIVFDSYEECMEFGKQDIKWTIEGKVEV